MSVYFIKPIGMAGPIKIGTSCSPTHRRCDLETWSPFRLEIIATVDGGKELERKFHAYFLHLHEGREWFAAGAELVEAIAALNSGTFDFDVLPNGRNLPPVRRIAA